MAIKGRKKVTHWVDPDNYRQVQNALFASKGSGGMSQFINGCLAAACDAINQGFWEDGDEKIAAEKMVEEITGHRR